MDRFTLGSLVALAVIACIFTAGCFSQQSSQPEARAGEVSTAQAIPAKGRSVGTILKDIGSAPAASIISDRMGSMFGAGLGLIIMGALTFAFGGKATGSGLMLLGVVTTGTGVLFIQYPWITLVIALAIGLLLVFVAYDRYRMRKKLQGTEEALALREAETASLTQAATFITKAVEMVPGGKEVKQALTSLGPGVVNAVKKVVSPIKEKLGVTSSET